MKCADRKIILPSSQISAPPVEYKSLCSSQYEMFLFSFFLTKRRQMQLQNFVSDISLILFVSLFLYIYLNMKYRKVYIDIQLYILQARTQKTPINPPKSAITTVAACNSCNSEINEECTRYSVPELSGAGTVNCVRSIQTGSHTAIFRLTVT